MARNKAACFTSKSEEWATPKWLFDVLNRQYAFTLDPCATRANKLCPTYFTKKEDGLSQSWAGHSVFINPPYGERIGLWVEKAYWETRSRASWAVMLLPARTDTDWWQSYCVEPMYRERIFIKGRLKFGGSKTGAPFPSAIVIFGNHLSGTINNARLQAMREERLLSAARRLRTKTKEKQK